MSAVSESIEDVLISSSATYGGRTVERPVNDSIPTCFELDTRQAGVDSYQLTLELSEMGDCVAGISKPAIEKVAGTASANVDATVFGQAEIEDFGAAVIERDSHAPSDLGQLLLAEGLRHCHVFVDRHNRVSEESQS